MFDGNHGAFLFCGFLLAGFLMIAERGRPPDIETAAPIEVATLPDLPETAALDGAPAQTDIPRQTVDLGNGFFATLLHGYVLEGKVVTRRQFWTDEVSSISPLDLGIVWGDLAEPGAIDALSFNAGQRMVWYRAEHGAILSAGWETQITNNHLIPASDAVRDILMSAQLGDSIRIRGYLVSVTGDDIRPWRSSTRRDDNTIIGGCEIILVRDVEVMNVEEQA